MYKCRMQLLTCEMYEGNLIEEVQDDRFCSPSSTLIGNCGKIRKKINKEILNEEHLQPSNT